MVPSEFRFLSASERTSWLTTSRTCPRCPASMRSRDDPRDEIAEGIRTLASRKAEGRTDGVASSASSVEAISLSGDLPADLAS